MLFAESKPQDFSVYACGLYYTRVCTSLSDEEATRRLNEAFPTGLDHGWEIADEDFIDGSPNGKKCELYTNTHRHILFRC